MISVTCAIIRNEEDEILVVQRGETTDHPFKWEFPGGKLAPGETEEECIIREVKEELSLEMVICGKLGNVNHDYGHKQIRLIPFICDTLDEMPFLSEHIAYKWVEDKDLMAIDFSEADIFVAGNYLERQKNKKLKGDQNNQSDNLTIDKDLQAIINNMMSMPEAEWVAASAIENPAIFMKLYEYSFSSDKHLSFRASWTLSKVCDRYPDLIYPYLPQIVDSLGKIDNESTLRSFLRILSLSDPEKINPRQQGILADFCFNLLHSGFSAIAVKAYSMEILYKLVLIYPELANELSTSILILMEEGSAGISSRGRMILKKLAEIPISPKSNQL
ncbi:MAG: (deoxy)nucleoside triphosphate pyrophosphohydrolase [Bacteroidia bacterium]|nr:(deoxy)nucleoside triphosphate pyrophosphohydrolase [Bacteroidia bacterium]